MKFIAVVAFLAATVYGAGIGDLPECSQRCVRDSVNTAGCAEDDLSCACKILTAYDETYDCYIEDCGRIKAVSKLTRFNLRIWRKQ